VSTSIPILRVAGCLLVSVQVELRDTLADRFQEDLLTELARSEALGLGWTRTLLHSTMMDSLDKALSNLRHTDQ